MPRTLPSSLKLVDAGCIEHPDISFLLTLSGLQSKIVEPLDVVVEGLTRLTVSLQKEGSIKSPSFTRCPKVDCVNLLSFQSKCFEVGRPELDRSARIR